MYAQGTSTKQNQLCILSACAFNTAFRENETLKILLCCLIVWVNVRVWLPYCRRKASGTCCIPSSVSEWWEVGPLQRQCPLWSYRHNMETSFYHHALSNRTRESVLFRKQHGCDLVVKKGLSTDTTGLECSSMHRPQTRKARKAGQAFHNINNRLPQGTVQDCWQKKIHHICSYQLIIYLWDFSVALNKKTLKPLAVGCDIYAAVIA